MLDWTIEAAVAEQGFQAICGIDEAGRGPLAGPVCAAAVILPFGCTIDGLNDSKKLTEKKREQLFDTIQEQALAYAIALVDHETIDRINILEATYVAMQQAVERLHPAADYALVDGNRSKGLVIPHQCVVGGDAKSPSIAAASILAKVTRDRLMLEQDALYPAYGFAKHKGYGTKAHYQAILEHGPSPIHRMTFLKKFYDKHPEARP
ncbi:ribonuclease HII [Intestinibacillus sp. Marseille-P6563]|uniref:ribonuclease HII n=1 Tax=Intestinibacillus sp. Marseille-P6563 TaxID=2364792 RepID=UPI000F071B35|nr:ribonuclease HII [Intestinibacillus sp. Marseille-P6563]